MPIPNPLYAEVLLPFAVGDTFTYEIPPSLSHMVSRGMRVIVPFGKKKLFTGIVSSLHSQKPTLYTVKPISSLLDSSPMIRKEQLDLWKWISNYYLCSPGEVMKAALPSGLKLESETILYVNTDISDFTELSQFEQTIISVINDNVSLTLLEISKIMQSTTIHSTVHKLLSKQVLISSETYAHKFKEKTQTIISLKGDYNSPKWIEGCLHKITSAPKQLAFFNELIEYCIQHKTSALPQHEITQTFSVSYTILKELEKKDIIQKKTQIISRIKKTHSTSYDITLNNSQKEAVRKIHHEFKTNNVCVLHGVTASGKTEVYINLIQELLSENKQVLYLLPEIALTSQIINRLRNAFGNKVGIYHSQLNDNERIELWNDLLDDSNGQFQVILGVRSSIFLPFRNLGAIIIDEEHEQSFKQFDPAPRYHARDTAIVLASIHNAKVLLGTATPSAETYFNILQKKYGLVELTKRHDSFSFPETVIIDLKKAYKRKQMRNHFSKELLVLMQKNLDEHRQILLFQNRRGYSPYITCTNCGHIPHCKNCDVSMTYHKETHQLVCHYCGYSIPHTSKCGVCGSSQTVLKGFGTEKIEEELQELFPNHSIARMDLDTTRKKHGHSTIIHAFENRETDILIGTQMVTKGLDFDNIGLVGILNADNLLNMPDFRAFEKGFQTLTQVAGRAGRSKETGIVAIQTFTPEHEVIQDVLSNNTTRFIKKELHQRQAFNYPPFTRLIRIHIKHTTKELTESAAEFCAQLLNEQDYVQILGPEFPPIQKIQKMYAMHILLKIHKSIPYTDIRKKIHSIGETIKKHPEYKKATIQFDVDPY